MITKNKKMDIEKMINDLYSDKEEDLKLFGNYNISQIYNIKNKNLKEKFKNSIVKNFF